MKNLLAAELQDCVLPTQLSRKITIGGETKAYPVYRVRLDQLYYNDQNDRISTWISQYCNQYGGKALALLNMDEYNDVIENFIVQSNPTSIEKTQMNIELIGQREPGVVLQDGRLIDGNRRFTCLRHLAAKDKRFNWFETVILESDMENDRKQIKMLELSIQHGEEKKVDYNPLDRLVGIYQDIVESEMLTVEEYAQSTNETVFEVRKRIGQAQMLVEFLDYIHMPKQYHIAREYQLVTILAELQDFLKKVSDEEKQQVKEAVFANAMMKTIGDSRKYIRNLNSMLANGFLSVYLKEQAKLGAQLQEQLSQCSTGTKHELECFIRDHEELSEELQLSAEKPLLKAKRAETRGKPSQIVTKSITMLKGVDTRIFTKLNDVERDKLRVQVGKLSQMIEEIDSVIGGNPEQQKATVKEAAIAEPLMEAHHEAEAKRYWITPVQRNAPILVCQEYGKRITYLSFSLTFTTYGSCPSAEAIQYRLFFVDKNGRSLCEKADLLIVPGEKKTCTFLLDARASSEEVCYLAIQPAEGDENSLQQLLPFEINMLFAADMCF